MFLCIGDVLTGDVLKLVVTLTLLVFSFVFLADLRLQDIKDECSGEDEDGDEGAEVVDEGLPCGSTLLELLALGVGLEDFGVARVDLRGFVEEFGGFEDVVG